MWFNHHVARGRLWGGLRSGETAGTAWYGLADVITVADRTIESPLSYVGSGLAAVHDTGGELEPSVIDPGLDVDFTSSAEPPDVEGLSYAKLNPSQRGAYLDWLSAAHPRANSPAWVVRLQLFGIERRLLLDHRHAAHVTELSGVLRRLEALRRTSAAEDSELDQALARLIVTIVGWPRAATILLPAPLDRAIATSMTSATEVYLGWSTRTAQPMSAATVVAAVRHLAADDIPTEAVQCPEDFDDLFGQRAESADLLTPVVSAVFEADERFEPASPSFKLPITVTIERVNGVDDGWLAHCVTVADQCGAELSSFARWRTEHAGDDPAPARRILMPPELGGLGGGALPDLMEFFRTRCADDEFADIAPAELDALWPLADRVTASAPDYLDLVRFLDRAGHGLVPDPRFGDPMLTDRLIAFRADQQSEPSAEVLIHLESLRLAWRVIVADDQVTDAEVWRLEDRLAAQPALDGAERSRILATHE